MITNRVKKEFYQALLQKDVSYDGTFYVGVKTTGIFCRPTCPARKPKFENCEFFRTAQEALIASFRPCKRCLPLSNLNQVSKTVQMLVDAVENNPEKRWKDSDFDAFSLDASTARRQFKKRFGMTFVQYARLRRMGIAMKQIRSGEPIIEAQLSTGYESSSGFRDAFSRIMGSAPSVSTGDQVLMATWLDTKLGPMLAIANEQHLYLLEFVGRRGLEREIERMRQKTKCAIIPGRTAPIDSIEKEIDAYFSGKLQDFKTPIFMLGTPFQRDVWNQLMRIPYGATCSYGDLAKALGKPTAFRAVAQANGANQLAIIIPCHRVINSNGELGGYGGGVSKKEWLLTHEDSEFICK